MTTGEVPVGTVTFLMTDVESSTRLWTERPEEAGAAIAQHYSLLSEVIADHQGVRPTEQGEGDSLVAVFTSAVDAVLAAADAQRRLAAAIPSLRVRIAIHTGEARRRDATTYTGVTLIRCARLRSCAHGGQVVLSDTTAALVADELPDEMDLIELGVARLRDLPRPERVWQLCGPGLDATFPPLRGLDAAPHNLPTPASSLIGRERELADLAAALLHNRLVTLTGPGGAGKTRLALAAARHVLDAHPGATWWIELAELTRSPQLVERIVHTMGLGSSALGDPLRALRAELGSVGETLVVLDNAEHLIDAVSELVDGLLETCPTIRFLVTSREPLGVPAETVWRIPPLASPADGHVRSVEDLLRYGGSRLFVERARAARPDIVFDERGTEFVAAISGRLDGLPLAIELAAARVRTLPLDRLAAGLDDAFRLLTGGSRTALPRHQTLAASIAWSVDLLEEADETLFRRLAIFTGSFTVDAAQAVASDGELVVQEDVVDRLGRLVDKSLVQLDSFSGRYRLLETLRQWGLDRLHQRGELAVLRKRHAEWCATWAEEVGALRHGIDAAPLLDTVPDVLSTLDWGMADAPEVVLRICAGLRRFVSILGPSACHRLVDWVLGLDRPSLDAAQWASAVDGLAWNAIMLDRPDILALAPDAIAALGAADLVAADLGRGVGLRLIQLMPAVMTGRYDGMEALCAAARRDGNDLDTKWLAAGVALFATCTGERAAAQRHLDLLQDVLDRWHLDVTPDTAGFGYGAAIDLATLEGRLTTAGALAKGTAAGSTEHVFPAAHAAAVAGYVLDDSTLLQVASRWIGREPPSRFASVVHGVQSLLALSEGNGSLAADYAETSWNAAAANGVVRATIVVPTLVAMVAAGRIDAALGLLGTWTDDVASYGNPPRPLATIHHGTALVAIQQGHHAEAVTAAHALLDLAHRAGFTLLTIDALALLSQLAASRGNEVTAARLAGATNSACSRCGYRRLLIVDPSAADALTADLASEQPTAFAEGEALDIDASVELARRMRGERGRPSFGWESLTPTERKVTDLVAEGLTNDQIATQLLMSPKTVRTHLTRIYVKLDVQNRTQLASAHARSRY